jgi:hypothetical protein
MPMKHRPTATSEIDMLERQLAAIEQRAQQQAEKMRQEIEAARARVRVLARGTGDVTEAAAAAARVAAGEVRAAAEAQPDMYVRIENALRRGPRTMDELVMDTGLAAGKVSAILRGMKQGSKVYNLGSEDRPRWIWVIGDNTPTSELSEIVERLITLRPMERAEIVEATGANPNRINGVLHRLQVAGKPVVNLGSMSRARWFMGLAKRGAGSAQRSRVAARAAAR